MYNLIIGSHVSFKKDNQLLGSVLEAISYKSNTFMFYTGAPQNTMRAPINIEITNQALKKMEAADIDKKNVIVHAPYIINLANNRDNYNFSIKFLKEEIRRVELLGLDKIVLHPGSHVGLGVEEGIKNIIFALNESLKESKSIKICLETMAGKGSECGSKFEEIKKIINGINDKDKIGVCLDTCHINDSGYDLTDFDKVLDEFDSIIGLDKLLCIHVNDSKNMLGSHKDRHENIGYGTIGFDKLLNIIYNPRTENIPKILETPYIGDDLSKDKIYSPYKEEIDMIRNKVFNPNLIEDIKKNYK